MEETLTQPRRVQEDTPQGRKLLLYGKNALVSRERRYHTNKDRLTPCQQPR